MNNMYLSVQCPQTPERGSGFSGAGAASTCELINKGAGN